MKCRLGDDGCGFGTLYSRNATLQLFTIVYKHYVGRSVHGTGINYASHPSR